MYYVLYSKNMYFVYVLQSLKNKDLYTGYSDDFEKRFIAHNNGKVKSTKGCRPWKLVYCEAYYSKQDATKREYQLKKHYYKEELIKRLGGSLK